MHCFDKGGVGLKSTKRKGLAFYLLLGASILLIAAGVAMLARTFAHYNTLFLTRQDSQLAEMASATDENIAVQLSNLHADLSYVLGGAASFWRNRPGPAAAPQRICSTACRRIWSARTH